MTRRTRNPTSISVAPCCEHIIGKKSIFTLEHQQRIFQCGTVIQGDVTSHHRRSTVSYNNRLNDGSLIKKWMHGSPLHTTPLFGSGCHCLLDIQVVTLGPVSTKPGEQVIATMLPTRAGLLSNLENYLNLMEGISLHV